MIRFALNPSERSALSGAFLHCFILFVFCFYICIVFLLIFVPLKESCLNPPSPKGNFQNFNFPKFQLKKKTIVPGLCLTPSSPHGLCRIDFFVYFCFF